MLPSHITDHVQQAIDRLVSQYQGRYYITQLLKALTKNVQDLENNIFNVLYCLLIDTADTVRLDILGKIVGQERGAFSDETYRLLILGKISANTSVGKSISVQALLDVIDPMALYYESHAATISIESDLDFIDDGNWELASAYIQLILLTKAAGVSYKIHDSSNLLPGESGIRFSGLYAEREFDLPGSLADADDGTGESIPTLTSGNFTNLITQ